MLPNKQTSQMRVQYFDLSSIPDGSVCVFIGKRKTGKSCAIRDLMWHKRYIPLGQIISGSERANPFFYQFFPTSYIEDEYSEDILDNILARQTKIRKFADAQTENKKQEIDTRFLLVFDDCLHNNKWQNTEQMKTIFMNGRHFGVLFLLSLQYVIGIPPALRTNIDYAFIFRETSIQNRRKLYENFGGCIPSFPLFCTLMDRLDKYECLVICTDADKVAFNEQVMYFKSTLRGPFKFGCEHFWKQDKKLKKLKQFLSKQVGRNPNANFLQQWNHVKSSGKELEIVKLKEKLN